MIWQNHFAQLVRRHLTKAQQSNPRFSLRSLSKKLEVSPSTLSRVLSGQSRLSLRRSFEILEKLEVSREEFQRFQGLAGQASWREEVAPQSSWLDEAVRHLRHHIQEEPLPEALARRLECPVEEIRACLTRLEKGEAAQPDPHRDQEFNLRLIQQALQKVPSPQRNFSSFFFWGSRERFDRAQPEIMLLQQKLAALLYDEDGENTELYSFSAYLYPLSSAEDKGG